MQIIRIIMRSFVVFLTLLLYPILVDIFLLSLIFVSSILYQGGLGAEQFLAFFHSVNSMNDLIYAGLMTNVYFIGRYTLFVGNAGLAIYALCLFNVFFITLLMPKWNRRKSIILLSVNSFILGAVIIARLPQLTSSERMEFILFTVDIFVSLMVINTLIFFIFKKLKIDQYHRIA